MSQIDRPKSEYRLSAEDTAAAEARLRQLQAAAIRGAGPEVSGSASGWIGGAMLLLAIIAVAWHSTFRWMFLRWFPGWDTTFGKADLAFTKRFTIGDSYYSHGPLVPVACLVMGWLIYRRLGAPVRRTRGSTLAGWALFSGSLLLHVASVFARVGFTSGFALIGALAGLLLVTGGWPLLKAFGLPVVFLVFMVPLPEVTISGINFELKRIAGEASLTVTNHVFGIPAVMEGSFIFLPPGPDGQPKSLLVGNVCGGLRSLISLTWFAALFAVVCRSRGGWRALMLLLAVPVAVLSNVVRITILNVGAHFWGTHVASEGHPLHDWSGLLVFVVALAILMTVDAVIVGLGQTLGRPWSDRRLLGFLEGVRGEPGAKLRLLRPAVVGAMLLTAVLSVIYARQSAAQNRSDFARSAVPMQIAFAGVPQVGADFTIDDRSLAILETRDYLFRRFRPLGSDPRQVDPVDLVIVFSPDNRKGTHPPDVCLEGGGAQIVSRRTQRLDLPGIGEVSLREFVTQDNGLSTMHMFVYKCGDRYTISFWVQQITIFLNGLTGRNAAGALIRFTLPVSATGVDEEAVRRRLLDAAAALMPEIDRNLP